MGRAVWALLVQALAFAWAALWAFDTGHGIGGMGLGALMGLSAGVFAALLISGLIDGLQRWWPLRRVSPPRH